MPDVAHALLRAASRLDLDSSRYLYSEPHQKNTVELRLCHGTYELSACATSACEKCELIAGLGGIRLCCQVLQQFKERWHLADEQPVFNKSVHGSHGRPFCLRGANYGAARKLSTQKWRRFGHDQVCLQVLSGKSRKGQSRIARVGYSRSIARLVVPDLKVHCLGWPDAKQNSQYLLAGYPLRQRWVQAAATLLDEPKMKPCGIGDRLDVIIRTQIGIVSGNRGMLPYVQTRDCLRKREIWIEIGVVVAAAVTRPPTGIDR